MMTPFRRGQLFWARIPRVRATSVQRSLGTGDEQVAKHMCLFLDTLKVRASAEDAWLLDQLAEGKVPARDAYVAFAEGRLPAFVAELKAPTENPDLEPYVARWVRELARRRRPSDGVREKYEAQVRTLITPGFRKSELTRPRIRQWLQDLPVGQPNRYRSALSSFAEFLMLEEILDFNVVRGVPAAQERDPRTRHLTPEEARRLVRAMPSPLHRAFQALLLCTAADVESALALKVKDFGEAQVYITGTKKAWRERTCYVYDRWAGLWEEFVRPVVRLAFPDALVFEELGGYDRVRRVFDETCAAIKLEDYTMKDHRHTWAVQAFKDRLPIHAIYQQLGHRDATMALKVYGKYQVRAEDYRLAQPLNPQQNPQQSKTASR